MLLPLTMLLVAKTPPRQKILPAARFSSTTIIIALSGARLGMSYTGSFFVNLFWLHFFGSLQCCVALTIYNGLATIQHRNKQTRESREIKSRTSDIAQEIQTHHASTVSPASEEKMRKTSCRNKQLPALPIQKFTPVPNARSRSQQRDRPSLVSLPF